MIVKSVALVTALLIATGAHSYAQSVEKRGVGGSAREAALAELLIWTGPEWARADVILEPHRFGARSVDKRDTLSVEAARESAAMAARLGRSSARRFADAILCAPICVVRGSARVFMVSQAIADSTGASWVHIRGLGPRSSSGDFEIVQTRIAVRFSKGVWSAVGEAPVITIAHATAKDSLLR
jgi:hypothetical protein